MIFSAIGWSASSKDTLTAVCYGMSLGLGCFTVIFATIALIPNLNLVAYERDIGILSFTSIPTPVLTALLAQARKMKHSLRMSGSFTDGADGAEDELDLEVGVCCIPCNLYVHVRTTCAVL